MTTMRKYWQTPAVNGKSVREALGSGETAGPMSKGLIAGPESMFGPPPGGPAFGPSPGPAFGPSPGPAVGPTGLLSSSDLPVFGPPTAFSIDGPPVQPSDVRLKEDIAQVGVTAHGLPLYTFRYRDQQGLYEGVMAQDVLQVRPDAVVVGPEGFYMVDYAKLGIEFRRLH